MELLCILLEGLKSGQADSSTAAGCHYALEEVRFKNVGQEACLILHNSVSPA